MTQHTVDWQGSRGELAVVQWCNGVFMEEPLALMAGVSVVCPECGGMLFHDGEFRVVVCTKVVEDMVEEEETRVMFRRILNEDCDISDL